MSFPVRLFINSPDGLLAFGPEHVRVCLPGGLDAEAPTLTYGPYFEALTNFLGQNDYQPLRLALSRHLGRPVSRREIQSIEITSQKHGAFYQVAQVRAEMSGEYCCFAINSAVHPGKKVVLEAEFTMLGELNKRFPLGFIPRPYVLGASPYAAHDGSGLVLRSLITEWFEDYHEFHLSRQTGGDAPIVRVWDDPARETVLSAREVQTLYHRAAAILTAYLDQGSFRQIYPWHHAAGDFILRRKEGGVELRLITVRGYQPLVSVGVGPLEQWLPLVHFFLNMSLRMRLDRLDGTGDLVWANPDCLQGVVSGFLEAWQEKAEKDATVPGAPDVMAVLRSFTPEEWLSLAELVFADGLVEAGEREFIQPRLEKHVTSLCQVLRSSGLSLTTDH